MAATERPTNDARQFESCWLEWINRYYPDYRTKLYTLPPVHFRKVPYIPKTIGGVSVLMPVSPDEQRKSLPQRSRQQPDSVASDSCSPQRVQDSDLRDDSAQELVLCHLKKFGKKRGEGMFIISLLRCADYLRETSQTTEGKRCEKMGALQEEAVNFRRPCDLRYYHEDFDVILIHPKHGILVGEIKSVGANRCSEQKAVRKRVVEAVKQMERRRQIIAYLTEDLKVPVTMTLILPFVKRRFLQQMLTGDKELLENLRSCLNPDAKDAECATRLCLCRDEFFAPDGKKWPAGTKLGDWWQHRMSGGPGIAMDVYELLLARFCGPATTISVACVTSPRVQVQVRTEGQAVSEMGRRQAMLTLTPEQVSLLSAPSNRVFLAGPPGTGKTLMLVLVGLQWLYTGRDVHVVSTWGHSLAAACLIHQQLQDNLGQHVELPTVISGNNNTREDLGPLMQMPGQPVLHSFDFYDNDQDVEVAVQTLVEDAKKDGELFVLLDEFKLKNKHPSTAGQEATDVGDAKCQEDRDGSSQQPLKRSSELTGKWLHFVELLCERVPGVHIWAASLAHLNTPKELETVQMTLPLRCAPKVLQQVKVGLSELPHIADYSEREVPTSHDGLNVVTLVHKGQDHEATWPLDCRECGRCIAEQLKQLGVGDTETGETNEPSVSSPQQLQYRDVFVLTNNFSQIHDDITDEKGTVTMPANGLVQGLREAGIAHVRVVRSRNYGSVELRREMEEVARAKTNCVTLAHRGAVSGLERKIVVWLPGRNDGFDDDLSDAQLDKYDRVYAMSRCTTQLIVVKHK